MQIFRQGPAYGVLRTVDGATEAGVVFERDGVVVGAVGNGRFGATLFQVDGGVVRALRSADTDGFYVPEATDVYAGPPGLNGSYTVTVGKFANGNRYAGVVNIRPLGDDLYRLEWTTATAKWTAIGVLAGDKLAVSWGSEGVGAVMLYERRGSSLDGRIVRFDFARKSAVHERFQLLP